MSPSHPDPDRPDWDWDPEPAWQPDPPWEPEPEPTPWSERERLRDLDRAAHGGFDPELDVDLDDRPPRHRRATAAPPAREAGPRPGPGYGPAYLAAAALLTVVFGLALLTVGLYGQGHWARVVLATGSGVLLLGLAMLALATWLVGGLERG